MKENDSNALNLIPIHTLIKMAQSQFWPEIFCLEFSSTQLTCYHSQSFENADILILSFHVEKSSGIFSMNQKHRSLLGQASDFLLQNRYFTSHVMTRYPLGDVGNSLVGKREPISAPRNVQKCSKALGGCTLLILYALLHPSSLLFFLPNVITSNL